MSGSLPDIDLSHLSPVQKLDLISELWDSLPNTADSLPVPEWHQRELDERLTAAAAEPEAAIPWEEVQRCSRERP